MYRAALFTITKRWNEDKDSVTDEWIKKIHTYMYYVYQLWPLWYISQLVVTPWTTAHQASLSSPSPGTCSNSRPLSWWCHPTISSSVIPFSYCPLSFLASESFLKNLLFTSGGQSISASALASILPMNIQDWFPLVLTALISLKSKGLSTPFYPPLPLSLPRNL